MRNCRVGLYAIVVFVLTYFSCSLYLLDYFGIKLSSEFNTFCKIFEYENNIDLKSFLGLDSLSLKIGNLDLHQFLLWSLTEIDILTYYVKIILTAA